MSEKKRLLHDLRVIDLRAELEKRNLDKSGVRGVLIQRLSKHMELEGHDPSTYKFELNLPEAKTPSKRTRRSESNIEHDTDETPVMEDMIVQDDAGDEEETDETTEKEGDDQQSDSKMDVEENKSNRKRDLKDDSEATEAKKPCLDKELKNDEDLKLENNTDAEDSINLDIGDDELLNEETDNNTKPSKKGHDITYTTTSKKIFKNFQANVGAFNQDYVRQGGLLTVDGERPALPTQLTSATEIDDGAPDDTAETADDKPEVTNASANDDSTPADDQQVKAEASATSNEDDLHEKEQKDVKDRDDGDKKDKKDDSKEGGTRNLWVSGLSGDTRAKDLKQLCSKHGKVIGAKVVTNARTPGSRCYGYVTMASAQDAESCIKNLHRTELHGRMISVEKAKSESESSTRRQPSSRSDRQSSKDRKEDSKDNEENKESEKSEIKPRKEGEISGAESTRSTSRTREKSHRSDKDRARRSTRSNERRKSPREVLSFSKIWKERDIARARERSRLAREEDRRRRAAEDALRDRERRHRQEKHRLELERESLRAEREKIEREKNELLRLERERHRLEREKLELERLELKRAQLRLEEERRKRGYESSTYRKGGSPPEPAYEREPRHKRPPPPSLTSSRGQFEAPPPPRFDMATSYDRGADKRNDRDRDYKRDYPRHVPSTNIKYSNNGSGNDDARQPMPPGTRPKEPSRPYESRDGRSYRPSPPTKPEMRNWNVSNRYPDTAPSSKGISSVSKGGSSSGGGGGVGSTGETWTASGETRYGNFEPRYPQQYQPPPPGASYPDRYAPPAREYTRKY